MLEYTRIWWKSVSIILDLDVAIFRIGHAVWVVPSYWKQRCLFLTADAHVSFEIVTVARVKRRDVAKRGTH
jgi:hypothetical protein